MRCQRQEQCKLAVRLYSSLLKVLGWKNLNASAIHDAGRSRGTVCPNWQTGLNQELGTMPGIHIHHLQRPAPDLCLSLCLYCRLKSCNGAAGPRNGGRSARASQLVRQLLWLRSHHGGARRVKSCLLHPEKALLKRALLKASSSGHAGQRQGWLPHPTGGEARPSKTLRGLEHFPSGAKLASESATLPEF